VQTRVHSATAEGLFANIADIVVGETDRAQVKSLLSREKLLARFEAGESAVDIDYRRQDVDLRPIWARTVLTMLRNPDTQDVEGVIYSLDVTAEKRNEEIFNIITSQEYDLIALLHLDTMQFEAVFTGETLPQFYRDFLPAPGYMCDFRRLCRAAHQSVVDEDARTVYADNSKIAYIRNRIIRDGHYEAVVKEKFPDCANGMMYRRFQHYALKDDDRIVLVIESDVTQTYRHQQQEVERERELRVQADAANQAKSDFLSSVSHDMRTPLNAVLGYAGIAKRDADIADVKGYLDKIERAGSVLKQLVEDTLDLNRISTGEVSLKKAPVDANEILQDLLATIKPAMDEKHITLIYDTSACPMAAVNVNADRLREILLNLLNNAMKYTDEGGMVTLRIERLSTEDSVAHDRITVADTGIGMSGEFLPKIFEPFSQERTERNADVGGSGLGLAVTKRLVELMGGTIEVQSQLDKGSTFTIHIDFELVPKKKEKPLSEKEPDAYGLSGRKALLVEDNEMNSEIMKMLLGRAGMDVVCAYNGKEALTMFEASEMGEYNVVLMDLRMPVMDGYEATRCIRALGRPDAENVPIIAVTANAFDEDIRTCLDVGMNAHVSKPVNPTALLATIADYVR
jgi:signal transduction histidine kinase/ActR/RegA family two-component response regulator